MEVVEANTLNLNEVDLPDRFCVVIDIPQTLLELEGVRKRYKVGDSPSRVTVLRLSSNAKIPPYFIDRIGNHLNEIMVPEEEFKNKNLKDFLEDFFTPAPTLPIEVKHWKPDDIDPS